MIDEELCYRAAQSRDTRFDGMFYVGVTSTRIYCRPSCPARPKRVHMRFLPTAASAQAAGFRACKRCRPDASPGSPEWNTRGDLVARAMRLINDGIIERHGVGGLAQRLGYSERQLRRQMRAEIGAGPLAVARAERAQTARTLLESSDLRATEVAFAAGFSSVRQFNDTVRAVYGATPTELRARSARTPMRRAGSGASLRLRLAYRAPLDAPALFEFLGRRAVPGVEEQLVDGFARVLALPHAPAVAVLGLAPPDAGVGVIECELSLGDVRDLSAAVTRCRRMLDLDADPLAIDAALEKDALLAPLVRAHPGRRVPGHVAGDELATRALFGRQVSVARARAMTGALVARYGSALSAPVGSLTHAFPAASTLACCAPEDLPMPRARQRAFLGLQAALGAGEIVLDPGADRAKARADLLALPGIGAWTASYIALRALGDPDAFLPSDLGVRHALVMLGQRADPRSAEAISHPWRPWRAYALQHLWALSATHSPRRATA